MSDSFSHSAVGGKEAAFAPTPYATRPSLPRIPPTGVLVAADAQDAQDGATFPVVDPTTENVLAQVAAGKGPDVDLAVMAARAQFDTGSWSRMSGAERGRLLYKLADLMERDYEYLADIERFEVGQPTSGPSMAIETLRYFAGWADKVDGRQVPVTGPLTGDIFAYTILEPVGVVAAITPWNAPVMLASWKLAPALAAGCPVIIKPSEDAPLATLHLGQLCLEAGFPPGVVTVVPGLGSEAGAALVRHPGIDKVSFTGSVEVGREVGAAAGTGLRRVSLELGGKSPQLVFRDADIPSIMPALVSSFTANAGQVCTAGTRVLVDHALFREVVESITDLAVRVRVGDPFDPASDIGPLVSHAQLDRVLRYLQVGVEEGAELLVGGATSPGPGFFVTPAVFRAENSMKVAQDEIFGPVACVMPFENIDEAIALANESQYGLAANIWTTNVGTAHRVASRLRAGTIRINGGIGPDAHLPRGGMKCSGIGRELSFTGMRECLEEKAVTIRL